MKHDSYYMQVAEAAASNSYAERKKVGACLVTKNQVILSGWNGTAPGMPNSCETYDESKFDGTFASINLVTRSSVIHSEMNAISKAAREGVSTLDSTLYVTLSPCVECSKMLIAAGVKEVVYKEQYRDNSGIELLKQCGIRVRQYD